MSKWIKRIIFAVITLLILSIVGIAVFFLTFDPNAYKDKLQEFVYERYERHLEIQGDIQLSLFPRIGLAVQGVQLSERGSEVPFAAVDNMRFSVAVWPLLWNHLVVDHLFLEGVQAWVEVPGLFLDAEVVEEERDHGGAHVQIMVPADAREYADTGGWMNTLLAPAQAQALEDTVRPRVQRSEFQIDIAGAEVRQATIYFFDPQQRWHAALQDLSLNTGRITFGQPFDVSMKGRLSSEALRTDLRLDGQGVLQVESMAQRLLVHRSSLQATGVAGSFKIDSAEVQGAAEYSYGQELVLKQLDMLAQGRWMHEAQEHDTALHFSAHSMGMHWEQAQFGWEKVNLRVNIKGEQEKAELGLRSDQFWMSPEQAHGTPIVASFKQARDREVTGLALTFDGYSSGWREFRVDTVQLKGRHQTAEQHWELQFDSALLWSHADAQLMFTDGHGLLSLHDPALVDGLTQRVLKGDFYIEPFNGHAAGAFEGYVGEAQEATDTVNERLNWFFWFDRVNTPPQLITHLEAEHIDLNQWIPSFSLQKRTLEAASASSSVQAETAPVPEYTELNWVSLPFEWSWRVEAKELRAESVWLQDFNADGKWQKKGFELSDLQARLYGGQMRAHAAWLDNEQFYGYLGLDEVNTSAVLAALKWPALIQGQGSLEATWQTWGSTLPAWRAGLNAHIQAHIEQGALLGFSAWEQLDAANHVLRQLFSGHVPPMPEAYNEHSLMTFDTARFELKGEYGQLQFVDLFMQGPEYTLTLGEPAWIDIVNEQLDVTVIFDLDLPSQEAEQSTEDSAKPPKFAAYHYGFAQAPIPFRITGPLEAPVIRIQWADMRHRFVQEAIQQGLLDVLGMSLYGALLTQEAAPSKKSTMGALVEDTAKYFGATLKEFLKRK